MTEAKGRGGTGGTKFNSDVRASRISGRGGHESGTGNGRLEANPRMSVSDVLSPVLT